LLVPAESTSISMHDDTVITDSVSTDIHLLQTSFLLPTLWTTLGTTDKLLSRPWPACLSNHDDHCADSHVAKTAVVRSSRRDYGSKLDTSCFYDALLSARSNDIVAKYQTPQNCQVHCSLGAGESTSQTASQSIQPFLTAVSNTHIQAYRHTDKHRDHTMCNICSNRLDLCIKCMQCDLKTESVPQK